MNTIHNQSEGRGISRPATIIAGLLAIVSTLFALTVIPSMAAAGPTEYPVRICSPKYPGQDGTYNGGVGSGVQVFHKAANGAVDYGQVGMTNGAWTVWDPVFRCASPNSGDGTSVANFGIRFFNNTSGIFYKNEEGGLQWNIPADLRLRQVGMKGRALIADPSGVNHQGGIGGGGTLLKFDFVGGQSKELKPPTSYTTLTGFSADTVQNVQAFRLGLVCNPPNGASVCMGASGEQALVNDLQFVMTDPTPPTISVNPSSIASGEWVKGEQTVTFTAQDTGSGLRETSVFIDDSQISERTIPGCDLVAGTFATGGDNLMQGRDFRPCPTTPQSETVKVDTTRFGDGQHTLKVCARDFAGASRMWNGDQKGPWICSSGQEVLIDNTNPTAPEAAEAISTRIPRSVNPNDVTWDNPGKADLGSPIHAAIYSVVNQAGNEVVPSKVITNGSDSTAPANLPGANNIVNIPTMTAPAEQGEFKLRVQLVDTVGHVSKTSEVPLSYSCVDSGGTPLPQADIAMGLTEPQESSELARSFLDLTQGEQSTVVGKVRGPGQMPINGANLCINAKPVVDPQLQLLSQATTNGNGNFSSPLEPGPSRNLLTVFRQGHREVWSDPVRTDVTVVPTFSTGKEGDYAAVRNKIVVPSGKRIWFKGMIPGPYQDQVLVVMQGKARGAGEDSNPKTWRAIRRYRTRFGGKFVMPYRFFNPSKTRRAHLLTRIQLRNQVGYPYSEGDSQIMHIVVKPKESKKKKKNKQSKKSNKK